MKELARRGWFKRFLDAVEWLGNLLPHPVSLFAILCFAVLLVSGIAGYFGLSVPDVRPSAAAGERIQAISLLNAAGLRRIVENLVTNFTGFVPLGTVLVALLGVGVADKSGLLSAVVRSLVLRAPKQLVTVAVVFAGVVSNTASEMGYVVLVPLAGVIFYGLGRHPLAGMAAAFAGVSGGYSANLLIGTVDPLLAGITEAASQLIDPGYEVHAAINWY
ncbi:MAG: AbgT family transporter, partial [Gammaproteobacteria bacterium]|nr:AbgT family transporter [Gammaproteobacteria bacterium]